MTNKGIKRTVFKKVELNEVSLNTVAQEAAVAVENFVFSNDEQRVHGIAVSTMTLGVVEQFMKINGLTNFFQEMMKTCLTDAIKNYYKLYSGQTFETDIKAYPEMRLEFKCGCNVRGSVGYQEQCDKILDKYTNCDLYNSLPMAKQVDLEVATDAKRRELGLPNLEDIENKDVE